MAKLGWPGWLKPHLWPRDPDGHIFLGRAFNIIGEVMWTDWTEHEVQDAEKLIGRRIPPASEAYVDGAPHWGLHREYASDVTRAAGSGHPDSTKPIPEGLWRAVASHNHQEFDRVRFAIVRRDAVVEECHRLALSGDLQFAWRRRGGGVNPQPIAPDEWEIDYPFVPFATLGYGEDLGLSSPVPSGWLFVTVASLNHVLGRGDLPVDDAAEAPAVPPSPKDEARAFAAELDAEGVPKRAVTSAMIAERWDRANGELPLVKTVTGFMVGAGKGGRPPGD